MAVTDVRPMVADTDSIGHTDVTGGSRVTFATGMAVYEAAQGRASAVERARREDLGEEARRGGIPRRQALTPKATACQPMTSSSSPAASRAPAARSPAARSVNGARRRSRIRGDAGRRRSRSRYRQGADPAMHDRAGCRQGDSSELRRRPDAGRHRAGTRMGAQRGIFLRRQGHAA